MYTIELILYHIVYIIYSLYGIIYMYFKLCKRDDHVKNYCDSPHTVS